MMQKDPSVPQAQGTIETFGFSSRTPLSDCHHWSIVPFLLRRPDYGGQAGTDTSLKTLTQHFALGYFHRVPCPESLSGQGTDFLQPPTFAILIATP
jgi:hypothetical protein